jgi:hypothetical protein
MSKKPTKYSEMTNRLGQVIEFYEHPIRGDEAEIICVNHNLKLASYSTFYDIEDMIAEHREYEPSFINCKFYIGNTQV